jgi:Dolichyl-phosphate-mannose-protein mannosyltransferase
MAGALRRTGLAFALPTVVGASTLFQWLAGRRLVGLWIMPDEAIYGERALALWSHGRLPLLRGDGAGYGLLYPLLAGFPLSGGKLATGYASLKLLQALTMSFVAVPVFFYGRRLMRPGYALVAAVLAVASPLLLYSGLLMTEVLIYPLGALALLMMARAVETTSLRDQGATLAVIAAATLTRVQSVVLVAVFAGAVLLDAFLARDRRRLRAFWPVWGVVALAAIVVAVAPGAFGAYADTLRGHYPVGMAAGLVVDHLSYLVLSTAIVPVAALAVLLVEAVGGRLPDAGTRALVAVTTCSVLFVVLEVGTFAARFAPHLLGRDLALLPPLLFTVFAVWLDRGAPRPRAVVLPVALLGFALLVLTPWNRLVAVNALPDTFGVAILYHLGATQAAVAVAVAATVVLALFLALPRRAVPLLTGLMVVGLAASSVVASNDIQTRVAFDQRTLVGIPPNWVERATDAPVAYLYDGENYWNSVWQVVFWNSNVHDVVSLAPSRVPGPMPQQIVRVDPDGQLPVPERYVIASDAHRFVGTPVAHLTQTDTDVSGLTLWRLDGPPRLSTMTRGVLPNGDMVEPARVLAYDCAGGRLELTLLPKSTAVVILRLDGKIVQQAHIAGRDYWNGTVFVPPAPSVHVCHFEIDGQGLLGSTRIAFVHR